MKLPVYVASKFENKIAVREAQAALRACGCAITYDWTKNDVSLRGDLSVEDYEEAAAWRCQGGVEECQVFVILAYPNMRGTFVELGIL